MERLKKIDEILKNLLELSHQSLCCRGKVGAAILDTELNVLSTGVNILPRAGSCEGYCQNHPEVEKKDCGSIHAEQIALIYLKDLHRASILISTKEPCWSCLKMIMATDISEIYYYQDYLKTDEDKEKHLEYWVKSGRSIENYTKISEKI